MFLTVALAGCAIWFAYRLYMKNLAAATALRQRLSGLHSLLIHKYYVDEIYGAVIVRPLVYFSVFLWKIVDVVIIDGFLNGLASLWQETSNTLRHIQAGQVRGYATVFVAGVVVLVAYMIFR